MADTLTAVARNKIPEAIVWRRDPGLPSSKQGLKVMGVPVGHDDFVVAQLNQKVVEHTKLLDRIPFVEDVQASWLLLSFCAAPRANFLFRTVRHELTNEFARQTRLERD